VVQFLHIHDKVAGVALRREIPDSVTCKLTSNGEYTATSAYQFQFEGSIRFPFQETIWNTDAPLKCKIFSWMATLGKFHTADCLSKKRMPHNAACVMCLSEPEMAVHLLANCPATRRVWSKVIATPGLQGRNLTSTGSTPQLQDWLCSTTGSLGNSGR
jgi:hypothetical protein